jgi:hypothetical protein
VVGAAEAVRPTHCDSECCVCSLAKKVAVKSQGKVRMREKELLSSATLQRRCNGKNFIPCHTKCPRSCAN